MKTNNSMKVISFQPKNQAIPSQNNFMYMAKSLGDFIHAAEMHHAPIIIGNLGREKRTLRKVIDLLGNANVTKTFGDIREIRYDPSAAGSIANSLNEHHHHTDGTFHEKSPSAFLLQFVQCDPSGGGISIFHSIYDFLDDIPSIYVKALLNADIQYQRSDHLGNDDAYTGKILSHENGRLRLRWRYDNQVKPKILKAYGYPIQEAIEWLAIQMKQHSPYKYQAKSGDIILINNISCTHGRTALSKNSSRSIRRAWLF